MKPFLDLPKLHKRILELYEELLEIPKPPVPIKLEHVFLLDYIQSVIKKAIFNEKEWKKYGFRVVHGNPAQVFQGCFCKEAEAILKKSTELGSGAYGTVHKSHIPPCVSLKHIPDSEWIAIKMESVGNYFSPDQTPEMLRKHVTIIEEVGRVGLTPMLYDVFICMTPDGKQTIVKVMEYVEGERLANWLEKASVANQKKVKEILLSKVEALAAMGIIHRDLHANNIMVSFTKRGVVKDVVIIDFDLAQRATNLEPMGVGSLFSKAEYENYAIILDQLIKEKSIIL